MDIHFVSSLTSEDENRVAVALVAAVQSLLAHVPIAYVLRVETSSAKVFDHKQVAAHDSSKPTVQSNGGPTETGHPFERSSTEH